MCPGDGGGDGTGLEEVLAVGGEDGTGVGEGVAEVEASGEPPREVKRQGCHYPCLLLKVEVVEPGDFVEVSGRLTHGLHEVVFLTGEPDAEDVFIPRDWAENRRALNLLVH